MNGACEPPGDQLCDCCTGLTQETPEVITNRPALSSIAYRAGRYATFNASMLAALSDPAFPALATLSTRDTTDFSIALLDAWAVALDILTFYQERFANEAFLRTAVDQRSVFELAALVGYEPSPGVAASAILAFTLSSAPGSPDNVLIPAGTRAQSVPGPGQTPQVFETSADLTAVIGWNALPAQTTCPWQLAPSATSTWIAGVANNISLGDALLFVSAQGGQPVTTGPGDFHYVTAVTVDPASGNTQITWDTPLSPSLFPASSPSSDICLYTFRKRAALYGVQAPNPQTLSGPYIPYMKGYPGPQPTSPGAALPAAPGNQWNYQYTPESYQINLDASYPGLSPPSSGSPPSYSPPEWIVLTGTNHGYTSFFQVTGAIDTNPGYYTLTSKTTQLTLSLGQILTGDKNLSLNDVIEKFVQETPDITAYVQSVLLTPAALPLTTWTLGVQYTGQPGMLAPVAGTSVSVIGGQQIGVNEPIGVSGKRLRLQVPLGSGATFVPAGFSAGTKAADGQVFLVDSFPPVAGAAGASVWAVITISGVAGVLNMPGTAGPIEFMPSATADPVVGEAAVVQSAAATGDVTALTLAAPLSRIYDAGTVAVNANAVEATNGQTVQEILGSGDGTNDSLQFTLKQAPLTYLPAPVGSGTQSTLQVWVNNLQWHETANLLTSGPADRAFVTSANAAGYRVVRFGNGVQGARTPTGTSNIRAIYRTGTGSPGMVSAGQLTQPLDRPQGLSSVTNPGAASGAADPASAGQARASAPLPTLTIGRVVSLEDYQNYALAFAGISKALATWTWSGNVRGVFLTVAGENGTTLSSDDPTVTSLIGAIRLCGDPHVPLLVTSYVPLLFTFTASVAVDQADYAQGQVLAQVWQNVAAAFAFDQRQLGQNVAASDIIEIIQQTAGVIAVQLQALGRSGDVTAGPVPALLCASGPVPPQGAQMLLLDPATQGSIGLWS
ncbi:MAG TPA: hypothetical protein VHN16_17150 [Streptosporangiaceae bacterium]|nr:hypothetical protein [Streptosporangiaceae bacterium]